MRLFCSYRFTGEDQSALVNRMQLVVDTLNRANYDAYCPLFDPELHKLQMPGKLKEIFDTTFERMGECDGLVAIIGANGPSEGQVLEIGAALSNRTPVYLASHSDAPRTHLPKLAASEVKWHNESDLLTALQELLPSL